MPRGQRVGEVVVFSGRATVNGVATGDVVVLEGPVTVTGQVNGSVIAADGIVRLAESARVGGDVISSEQILARPGAEVGGETRDGVRFSFEGPLVALGKLLGPVAVSVSVLLMGLALVFLAPRAADAVAEALSDAPLASLGWGILVAIFVPIASVALVISVLGLPLGLTLLLSFGLWWLVALTWATWCAGRALVRAPRGRMTSFLAGWAIVAAVGLVPILNVAVWTLAPGAGPGRDARGGLAVTSRASERPPPIEDADPARRRSGSRVRVAACGYSPATSAPAINAMDSSLDAPPLRSTIATRNSANKVSRSTKVDIAAISGRRMLRSELST